MRFMLAALVRCYALSLALVCLSGGLPAVKPDEIERPTPAQLDEIEAATGVRFTAAGALKFIREAVERQRGAS